MKICVCVWFQNKRKGEKNQYFSFQSKVIKYMHYFKKQVGCAHSMMNLPFYDLLVYSELQFLQI